MDLWSVAPKFTFFVLLGLMGLMVAGMAVAEFGAEDAGEVIASFAAVAAVTVMLVAVAVLLSLAILAAFS